MKMSSGNSWTVNSYENDAWTTIVDNVATISTILVVNTTAGALTAQIRLADGAGTELARVLPARSIAAATPEAMDFNGLEVGRGQFLQVKGSAAGLHFIASGRED